MWGVSRAACTVRWRIGPTVVAVCRGLLPLARAVCPHTSSVPCCRLPWLLPCSSTVPSPRDPRQWGWQLGLSDRGLGEERVQGLLARVGDRVDSWGVPAGGGVPPPLQPSSALRLTVCASVSPWGWDRGRQGGPMHSSR